MVSPVKTHKAELYGKSKAQKACFDHVMYLDTSLNSRLSEAQTDIPKKFEAYLTTFDDLIDKDPLFKPIFVRMQKGLREVAHFY